MSILSSTCRLLEALSVSSSRLVAAKQWNFVGLYSSKNEVAPLLPKRPKTAFFRFVDDYRPVVRASQPNVKVSELCKICGQKWAELSPDKKQEYEKITEKEFDEWRKTMTQLKVDQSMVERIDDLKLQKAQKKMEKSIKKAKNAKRALNQYMGRPKPPLVAHVIYFRDNFQSIKSKLEAESDVKVNASVIAKASIEAWRNQSEEVRAKYETAYAVAREAFVKRSAEWKDKMVGNEELAKVNEALKKAKAKKKKLLVSTNE